MPWYWPFTPAKPPHLTPTDAIRNPSLRARFEHFLEITNPPSTFKASQVAQELSLDELRSMGYETWEELLPAVVELALELREAGFCQVFKQGNILPEGTQGFEIEGSVRIGRVD